MSTDEATTNSRTFEGGLLADHKRTSTTRGSASTSAR